MKVVLITEYFLPVKGGIEVHCYNLAKELKKRGIEIEVHTSKNTPLLRNVLKDKEIIDGIHVIRHRWFKLYLPRNIHSIDVLHLHNFNIMPHSLILFYLASRKILKMKIPKIVITLHGGFTPHWKVFPRVVTILKKLYHFTIGKMFLNYFVDKIICVSPWECDEVSKKGLGRKIVFIPNGVEELAYDLPPLSDEGEIKELKPYILYLGRITRCKKLESIIQAIKDLANLRFVIAGPISDIEYYVYLLRLIKKLRVEHKVLFIGEVWNRIKYELIDNALAIILVSEYESEGIVIKEAMARGKPIIVSSIPVFKYLIQDGVNGFIVNSVEEIKQRIVELLNNEQLRNSMGLINRRISHIWRWDIIAEKIIKVYTE